ncbi:hypothetical protein L226DRAFT_611018 [Lentinus tigrinus ALCF2SS1-7]|uniref:RING-type domain-containing protein n=1 Tax=Lentinus tigrinus ALCF2SS1-6 TaxID=1328759 RepID=A0A5C2SGL3_9APHY|nr:hypothetical protein L227DRAFT_544950 [Lentinus tigrinus ALCF2SS1-6]RPD77815.1 hypothetical protein L226DRAFT_611018 [Lentinus tigrinus ALCF2SS1-7]
MANTAGSLPRRRSTADVFFFFRNPDAANAARSDLINMVEEMRQRSSQLDDFASALPKVTESQLAALGQSDGTCPICLTSLLAILAEEETAIAMDSPAHPIEELGVTRLAHTCGHIFCRKDIRGWLYQGHTTCPTCRTPFIAVPEGSEPRLGAPAFEVPDAASFGTFLDNEAARALHTIIQESSRPGGNQSGPSGTQGDAPSRREEEEEYEEAHFEYNDDRSEFAGMYS